MPRGKEETMIEIAYGYELQTKGRYQKAPVLE